MKYVVTTSISLVLLSLLLVWRIPTNGSGSLHRMISHGALDIRHVYLENGTSSIEIPLSDWQMAMTGAFPEELFAKDRTERLRVDVILETKYFRRIWFYGEYHQGGILRLCDDENSDYAYGGFMIPIGRDLLTEFGYSDGNTINTELDSNDDQ